MKATYQISIIASEKAGNVNVTLNNNLDGVPSASFAAFCLFLRQQVEANFDGQVRNAQELASLSTDSDGD